jgi:hypothetical protein
MKRRARAAAALIWRENRNSTPEILAKASARTWKRSPPVEGSTYAITINAIYR